ncbi:MAG: hypothetical protein PHV74_03225 [Dehalococcoidia bacterium]|nr:hypothetical protein [Dehalococcoidia bacterium]
MLAEFIKGKSITRLALSFMLVALLGESALVAYGTFFYEEDKAIVFAGPEQNSTLQLRGAVLAKADPAQGCVDEMIFTVALADGAEPVNFAMTPDANADGKLNDETAPIHTVMISYVDADQRVDDLTWSFAEYGPGDEDTLLESGENFRITLGADNNGHCGLLQNALSPQLGTSAPFTIEVKTPNGEVLRIERVTPDVYSPVMNLS